MATVWNKPVSLAHQSKLTTLDTSKSGLRDNKAPHFAILKYYQRIGRARAKDPKNFKVPQGITGSCQDSRREAIKWAIESVPEEILLAEQDGRCIFDGILEPFEQFVGQVQAACSSSCMDSNRWCLLLQMGMSDESSEEEEPRNRQQAHQMRQPDARSAPAGGRSRPRPVVRP